MSFLGSLWNGFGEVLDTSGEIYENGAQTTINIVSGTVEGLSEVLDTSSEIYENTAIETVKAASISGKSVVRKIVVARIIILFIGLAIIFVAYKVMPNTLSLSYWLALIFPVIIIIEIAIRGKKSIILKLLKYIGLPALIFAGSFFSRDSFIVKSIRGLCQGVITFIHGILSDRCGYNRGYEDAINGKSKCWWRKYHPN